jgi:hypothetical protein
MLLHFAQPSLFRNIFDIRDSAGNFFETVRRVTETMPFDRLPREGCWVMKVVLEGPNDSDEKDQNKSCRLFQKSSRERVCAPFEIVLIKA